MLSFVFKTYLLCLAVLVFAVTALVAENIEKFEKNIPDGDDQEFIFLRKKRSTSVNKSTEITTMAPVQGVTTSDPIESDSLENENMFLEFNDDILLSRDKRQVEGCGEEPLVSASLTMTDPFTTSLSSRTNQDATTFDSNLESVMLSKCQNRVPGLTSATVKGANSNDGRIDIDFGFTSAVNRKEIAECLYDIQKDESLTVGTRTFSITNDIFISNAASQNVGVVCYLCGATETCLPNAFSGSFYCGTTEMFPSCATSGDLSLTRGDDLSSEVIEFPGGVPFQDRIHYNARVNVDGFISFGDEIYIGDAKPFPLSRNAYILAPFWTDIDTTTSGKVCYQLYDKTKANPIPLATQKILKRASDEVRQFSNNPNFDATTVLISTWNQVLRLGSTDSSKTITFQSVLISDGFKSFAMMFYRDFSWNFVPNLDIIIGHGSSTKSYSNPASGTQAAFSMHSAGGNTGHNGIWFYEIGQAPRNFNPAQSCLNWYQVELASLSEIRTKNNQVPACPCSINTWRLNRQRDTRITYRNCFFRNNNMRYNGYTRLCCYQNVWGAWLRATGSLVKYNSRFFPQQHEIFDRIPYNQCCLQSNMCRKYFEVRPTRMCRIRMRFRRARGWGDPHISTIDGREYVFNGLGEYIYLLIENINFSLQIRTLKALRSNGQESSATIFAGFALKEGTDTRFQVEMDTNRTSLIIYGMGVDITREFYSDTNYKYAVENKLSITRDADHTVEVTLNSEISLQVALENKALKSTISIPNEFETVTKGLLGNFDGDKTNDLISRTGTTISDSSTNKQIFEVAKSWAVSEAESLFIYRDGLSYQNFNFPNFVPFFMEDASDADKTTAANICGSTSAAACIYDYLATGDAKFANATKQLAAERNIEIVTLENTSPNLTSSSSIFKVTLGVESTLTITGSDEDAGDTVNVSITDQPSAGFQFTTTGSQVNIKWTPANTDPVNITINANDNKNAAAPTLNVAIFLCTGCSKHGNCSETISRGNPGQASSDTFTLAKCTCERGYTGDDCEQPVNFCSLQPCDVLQTCSNNNSAELGYTCSACPTGYNTSDNKCIDIDECEADPNVCGTTAICVNTVGSYKCNCKIGYRLIGSQCSDVNECFSLTHDCSHTCNNTEGSFICGCYSGFTLAADGKTCTGNASCTKNCEFACEMDKCMCAPGKKLKADGLSCEDIDECSLDVLCEHTCKNEDPGFNCSCLNGYKLGADKLSCTVCELNKWGPNCENTCNCRGRGTCDNIRGCQCSPGWSGEDCSVDVDECVINPARCGPGKTCVNLPGTFECRCPSGYELNGTSCVDINECSDLNFKSGCNQTCVNTLGSYYCDCNPGYVKKNGVCEDVDECSSGTSGCEQGCTNVAGRFNCFCNYGFEMTTDRKTCAKLASVDPCSEFPSLGCEYACRKNGQNNPECYCPRGKYLAADGKSCLDVDECSGQNSCSDGCVNTDDSYNCTCPIGKGLADDDRTCIDCPDNKWGENCANECNCSPFGASGCNKTTGCICKTGWAGNTCADDLNECSNSDACSIPLTECVNTPGSFTCICKSGYKFSANRTQCEDINECAQTDSKVCDQTCTNTDGSFLCSCSSGFILNGTKKCDDIDECSGSNGCQQKCINNEGSYLCSCFDGFELTSDRGSCKAIVECDSNNNCSQTCSKINNVDTCSCTSGYKLAADNATCENIDECSGSNPCVNGQCVDNDGGYTCKCNSGFKQQSDNITCRECPEGTYGYNCVSPCSCDRTKTLSCNKADGKCNCKNGWTGNTCTTDEDECSTNATICSHIANSTCKNTNGSFLCECDIGFYSSNGVCKECDDTHYGKNCASPCTCIVGNSASCNKQTGACTCKASWQGTNCETDKNECDTPNICDPLPICNNTVGSYECNCNSGYTKQGNTCQNINECLIPDKNTCTNLGQQCKDNDGSFTCECKSGFTKSGSVCEDVNECSTNNGGCEETCNNFDGSFNCSCPAGQTLSSQDEKSCYVAGDSTALETVITLDIRDKNDIVKDSSSYLHRKLKTDIAKAVYTYLNEKTSSAVLDVVPRTITLGSVISNLNILINTSNPETMPIVSKALYDLLQGGSLTVGGVVTPVLSPLNTSSVSFTKDSRKCDILAVLQPCEKNTICEENGDGVPKCRDIENDGPTEEMIIGLSVGIPVFFILCIIIAIIVYVCIKKRKRVRRRPQEYYQRSPFQTIFASNIPKRSGLGANRYGLYSPDTMSQASFVSENSSSSESRKSKRKPSKLDYKHSSMGHENPAFFERPAMRVDQAPSNFSWDFMFRALEPMHNFEIQRPKVEKRAFHPLKHSRA